MVKMNLRIYSSPNFSLSMGGKDYNIKYYKISKKIVSFSAHNSARVNLDFDMNGNSI